MPNPNPNSTPIPRPKPKLQPNPQPNPHHDQVDVLHPEVRNMVLKFQRELAIKKQGSLTPQMQVHRNPKYLS